jgi:crotonobetainyl-CoA:carnitine CoA-transferase CaiB-like acyl-CoA transferase
MTAPFTGVRVVEVAAYLFVPVAGAVLADLGADVVKIEAPGGDPLRGLRTRTLEVVEHEGDVDPFAGSSVLVEIANRGKRSMVVDLRTEAGHDVLMRLVESADVFLTSYLPSMRSKLGIDVADLRAVNPDLIYVRGSGWGAHGPMRDRAAFDMAAAWASGGAAHLLAPRDGDPAPMPHAFFDVPGGGAIAGAVGAALFQRERTGTATVVDVSLLNVGWWTVSPAIVAAPYTNREELPRSDAGNPVVNSYRTADDRWLYLVLTQSDRFWSELCTVLDRPDLLARADFGDADARARNSTACVRALDGVFAGRTLAEWEARFEGFSGVWAPAMAPGEIHRHLQHEPNGFLPVVRAANGSSFRLVAPPMQFGEQPTRPRGPAPAMGQHTEEVLVEAGYDWEEIAALHACGALG